MANLVQEQNIIAKELSLSSLKENIQSWASQLGFSSIGITDIDLSDEKNI